MESLQGCQMLHEIDVNELDQKDIPFPPPSFPSLVPAYLLLSFWPSFVPCFLPFFLSIYFFQFMYLFFFLSFSFFLFLSFFFFLSFSFFQFLSLFFSFSFSLVLSFVPFSFPSPLHISLFAVVFQDRVKFVCFDQCPCSL